MSRTYRRRTNKYSKRKLTLDTRNLLKCDFEPFEKHLYDADKYFRDWEHWNKPNVILKDISKKIFRAKVKQACYKAKFDKYTVFPVMKEIDDIWNYD